MTSRMEWNAHHMVNGHALYTVNVLASHSLRQSSATRPGTSKLLRGQSLPSPVIVAIKKPPNLLIPQMSVRDEFEKAYAANQSSVRMKRVYLDFALQRVQLVVQLVD